MSSFEKKAVSPMIPRAKIFQKAKINLKWAKMGLKNAELCSKKCI
jgi:hypothetical protein